MKSGERVKTLGGKTVTVPYAGEHPCFGQRQGWCKAQATWRVEGPAWIFHFCEACKETMLKKFPTSKAEPMEPRPGQ